MTEMKLAPLINDSLKRLFVDTNHVYFITIKPAPGYYNIEDIVKYLEKKKQVSQYWIVTCKSELGFIHYHGLIKFNEHDNTKNVKALARKIQRDIGYNTIMPMSTGFNDVYGYIRSVRNTCNNTYEQRDYYRYTL